jgi:tape measure domain-containing protein
VAIYTADIQIAVRGATQVTNLQQRLNTLAANVDQLNARIRGGTVASITNLNNLVSQSDRIMRSAAAGTRVQRDAIDAYVRSTAAAERAEVSLQRAIAGRRRELGLAQPTATGGGGRGGSFGSRIGGAVSGAVIGGSFPLLFGQGAGAATGGAIGGLVGGLLGPGGSFAGSLLGTLIGDLASKGQVIKKLGEDIGFSAEQTRLLEGAFKQAGSEFDKFETSVQNIRGLSLDIEDQANAIRLVSTLTKNYGGEIDKVTNAYTSALESGKVTQATLNQLTSQSIPIQQALADKYKVSRSEILQMAKDGKISVQELSDTLVEMGNKGVTETNKTKSGFDVLKTSVTSLGSELAGLGGSIVGIFQGPFNWLLKALGQIIQTSANGIASLRDLLNFSTPAGEKAKAALQAGRLPTGPEGVIDVIGEERYRALGEQAGPGPWGFGRNLEKFQKLLQQQPEFQVAKPPTIQNIKVPGQLPPSGGGGKSAADKAAKDAEREAERVAELVRSQALVTAELKRQEEFSAKIFAAELAKDPMLARRLKGEQQLMEWGYETANLLEKEQNAEGRLAIAQAQQAKQGLIIQETAQDLAKIEQDRIKSFDAIIADLNLELALKTATTEQEREQLRIAAERAKLEAQFKGLPQSQIDQITGLQAQVAAPLTDVQKIDQHIGKLKTEIADLTSLSNIAITSAEGIGNAFAQSFQGLISGTMTAKEALGSFFKSVADMFLEMAAQIIAKQITMIILQTILKALGGGAFSGGTSSAVPTDAAGWTDSFNTKLPGITSVGKIGFAKGGAFSNSIVSSPTLFKFADGGTTRTGLMGEAGPEAIMPLKRGSDGSLGVQASGLREAMGAAPGSTGGGAPVLNMSFQSSTINGVEYVSRDQLEAAMAQTRRDASRDGAKRGMTMTLDKLQQSPSTRSRVGMR